MIRSKYDIEMESRQQSFGVAKYCVILCGKRNALVGLGDGMSSRWVVVVNPKSAMTSAWKLQVPRWTRSTTYQNAQIMTK